jgi:hypothetical protein
VILHVQGEIEIIDVEPDVFLHLLKFLYTHRLDTNQELNLQLAVPFHPSRADLDTSIH